jgi:aspartyl protease family protein
VTNGFINGEPVTFMLDTGATDVVIPESIAKSLGLNRLAYSEASTANGTIPVYKTRIDQLSIGNIKLYDVPASINPSMTGEQAILLGMSALKQLELIQKNRSLTLIQG